MNISNAIHFSGDGINDVWPLPFKITGEIVVSILLADGIERRLLQGRDYQLIGSNLVIRLEEGQELIARQLSRAKPVIKTEAYAPAQASQPVYSASYSLSEEELGQALERRYNELSSRLRQDVDVQMEALRGSLSMQVKEAMAKALAEIEKARRTAKDEARLANAPIGQRSHFVLANGAKDGAYLSTELAYLPGTNSLQVYFDGLLVTPGKDYQELGKENEPSYTIQALRYLAEGTVVSCLVNPIPSSEKASRAEASAQKLHKATAAMLADAQKIASQTSVNQSAVTRDASLAQGWAGAAQKSANLAYQAAASAYDAAAQISLYRREPGISAVKEIASIHACSPGLFIINPHLTHAPTPFFGIWPANCIHEMNWDGVFFLGGKCYPPDPELPPKRPPKPAPDPAPLLGGADEWIPCNHSHISPPPLDGCGCIAWPYRENACGSSATPAPDAGEGGGIGEGVDGGGDV